MFPYYCKDQIAGKIDASFFVSQENDTMYVEKDVYFKTKARA